MALEPHFSSGLGSPVSSLSADCKLDLCCTLVSSPAFGPPPVAPERALWMDAGPESFLAVSGTVGGTLIYPRCSDPVGLHPGQ